MEAPDKRFVVSEKIKIQDFQKHKLDKDYYKANRLYNNVVRYVKRKIKNIERTKRYKNIKKLLVDKDISQNKKNKLYKEIKDIIKENNLTEYDLEKYAKFGNLRSFEKSLMSQTVQVLVAELYKSVEGYFFKGTKIYYRKAGHTNTLSSKSNNCTILFNKEDNSFKYQKMLFDLKDIKENDYYIHEALDNDVALCKIIRKLMRGKYAYYLQIVLKGAPPKKFVKGNGVMGIDQGTSTIAIYGNDLIDFIELAPKIDKYNKDILRAQRKMNRKLIINNPDCYNENGTIKKETKLKISKSYKKELFKLKDLYRRKTCYVQEEHNKIAKLIVSNCDTLVKETLNFKVLQKRSKGPAKRQDKESKVKDKNGNIKKVYKFKRKKRFGRSLNNHSPGYLDAQILKRAEELGIKVVEVDMLKYRASQYRHDKDDYVKVSLADRYKDINGQKVQSDLYSAFLLYNFKDEETIDRDKCIGEFNNFIRRQDMLIKNIKDNTGNFGLRNFQ